MNLATKTASLADAPRGSLHTTIGRGATLGGRYRIVRLVAAGATSQLYEAEDEWLGGSVAVKLLSPSLMRVPGLLDRLRREGLRAMRVSHPNVCRVVDLGLDTRDGDLRGPRAYVVMELVRGETLASRIARGGRFTVEEALPIARQIGDALDALHRAGLVHREVRAQNVHLVDEPDGGTRVVLTDCGLARLHLLGKDVLSRSVADKVAGVPTQIAPEELLAKPATHLSDIYALGVLLFEMVTGRTPHAADTLGELALRRIEREAPWAGALVPELDPRWSATIAACLERDPARRPLSAAEAIARLGAAS